MRNGHKGRMACGILELMLGVGLILYICLADRQRIGLAAVAAVVVTAGLGTFCTGATAVPAKRKEETVQSEFITKRNFGPAWELCCWAWPCQAPVCSWAGSGST